MPLPCSLCRVGPLKVDVNKTLVLVGPLMVDVSKTLVLVGPLKVGVNKVLGLGESQDRKKEPGSPWKFITKHNHPLYLRQPCDQGICSVYEYVGFFYIAVTKRLTEAV